MEWLRLACGYGGMAIGIIGGNIVWLLHCHRTNKSNIDWFHGPWRDGQWKDLSRREKRSVLTFTAVFLGSFLVFFVWLKP